MAAHDAGGTAGGLRLCQWGSTSGAVRFERGGATAVKTKLGWDDGLVLTAGSITMGKARWAFYIGCGHKISIGAVEADVSRSGYVNKTTKGWGYYQANGRKGHGGSAKEDYGIKYQAGDVVVVEIDATEGTVEFFLNDASQGVAFRSLPRGRPLKAAVSLYGEGDQVTLLGREGTAGPRSACFARTGSHVTGTPDGLLWTKCKTGWDDGLVLIGGGIRTGSAKWTFKVRRGAKLTFGVCLSDVPLVGYLNQSKKGWGWYQGNGKVGRGGPAGVDKRWPKFGDGDVVEARLDADEGTLVFHLNGRRLGVAFDDLPRDGSAVFVGGFSMYAEGSEVEVLHIPQANASASARAGGAALSSTLSSALSSAAVLPAPPTPPTVIPILTALKHLSGDALEAPSPLALPSPLGLPSALPSALPRGECSFLYRYILRESYSQFDSLPLTSLTIPPTRCPVRSGGDVRSPRRWARPPRR